MSKPSSLPKADKAMEAFSFALRSCSSAVLGLSVGGKQKTCWAKPFLLTKSRRDSLISIAAMREAPRPFARQHARAPIAPVPRTRTEWPLVRPARREAWTRTERGSARAAFSYEQLAGKLRNTYISWWRRILTRTYGCRTWAGWFIRLWRVPSTWGKAEALLQKRMDLQRL